MNECAPTVTISSHSQCSSGEDAQRSIRIMRISARPSSAGASFERIPDLGWGAGVIGAGGEDVRREWTYESGEACGSSGVAE